MSVSLVAILLSGIASIGIGFLWYHPRVFGAAWMRLARITPEIAEKARERMLLRSLVSLVSSMLLAYMLGLFARAWAAEVWQDAIALGFLAWFGFAVPILLSPVLWEREPLALFAINASYWLAAFIAIALIVVYV